MLCESILETQPRLIPTQASRVLFFPQDRSVPPVRIVTRQLQTLLGQRIIVSIDSWPADSRYPQVHEGGGA